MKKQFIIICILNFLINTQGNAAKPSNVAKSMPIYLWHQDQGYAIKEVNVSLKQIAFGKVKDRKSTKTIHSKGYVKFNINEYNRKKKGYYIDYIKIKYDTEAESFLGVARDISYKFKKKIYLGDEELEFVILATKKNTGRKASDELVVYKGYRDRVRADLKRYIKVQTTNINQAFNVAPGDSLNINNIIEFPVTRDNKIGENAYTPIIIEGKKD